MRNDWIRRMLFPIETDGKIQTKLRKHSLRYGGFVDPVLNYEQAHGVISASSQDYGVLPFIISGPPGTGKTKTIVEVALQLLKTPNISHILIVAPSESAADTLADRLRIRLDNKQLLRLNGPWRNEIEVLSGLSRYCCLRKDRFAIPHFAVPHFADLMRYNVVITSARDVSLLADARVTNSDLYNIEKMMQNTFHPENHRSPTGLHWGALLMDEAAQATELDTLAALSIVCPPVEYPPDLHQPPFILAGDQHQLGPKTASRHPLYSQSLFGRLSTNPVYSSHPLSRSNTRPTPGQLRLTAAMLPMPYPPFINLTRNYRSHPAILSVPSHLFYHDTLIPEAHQPKTPLQSSPLWVGRKWPVVFVPHAGPDDIERDNAGWYNLSEATLACDIAAQLIEVSWVRPRDIVIMSPFAAQVKRLRALMRSRRYAGGSGYWEVNIGPLEAFQGLESRVVILCTTRTREKQVEEDIASGAGVVGMRRRMNVALTRAKEGLIVIGSEKVLGTDEAWRAFMSFCARNGLVRGQLERRWGDEREDLGVLGEDYDGYGGSEGEEEEGEGEGEEEEGEEEGGEEWEDGYEEGEEREEAARN
ncbi:P-loop containing nucleoside triphosphate hydrolase protein [Dendryphion nanum]|uniref:P-loop containing nucleoside triphosphate hydrolase protein n=1 Tax=Dendryphion nanum TaxID=256645 RepID=A0A9P9EDF1_9PLEO|nr:P-loop containing nucleoside triphosphate hydrolase protein [Dendryphion nanum]